MWGYNDEIPIKTAKILQNPMFWTFLTFLIFLIVIKAYIVLTTPQGFQKGIMWGYNNKNSYYDGHLMAGENYFGGGGDGGKLFFIGLI